MADNAEKTGRAMRDIVKDPALLQEKRRELDTLRQQHNVDWGLNQEFIKGNQWVYWNKNANRVESLGTDRSEMPRYKVRLTTNEMAPGTKKLVAQMTKTRPVIRAVPNSGADRDVKAAQFAERLYEDLWGSLGLGPKLTSALTKAQISQGFWLITWDELAGKSMRVTVGPDGQRIEDEDLADIFREELRTVAEQQGMDPKMLLSMFEQTVYMGDIDVKVLDGPGVWLDPIATNFEDARYAICKVRMDVDDIEARTGKRVVPDASTVERKPQLQYTKSPDETPKNARDVFFLYHRPSPSLPKGKYVMWIEGPNEILKQSDWPYPFTMLPLVKFPGIEGDTIYDIPRGTGVRPLQEELNNKVSKVAMHMNLTLKPQMIAPVGSLRQRLTDEPGAVFEYAPIQGLAPEWRPIPAIPQSVYGWIDTQRAAIGRLYNDMPAERSQLPARTDSGHLVALVQEAVADQIADEIQRMEIGLARAGDIIAAYAQEKYTETRMLKVAGPGGGVKVEKFTNVDLAGGFSFQSEAGSGLPRSREGRFQQLKEMVEMGAATVQDIMPYLPITGLKTIQARIASDEEFAQRKITKLLKGEPLNLPAMMDAIRTVESGMNPQTEEMFQSPDEAIAFVEQASLSPHPFENIKSSAYVLGEHMKSPEFEKYEPDVQARFLQHYTMLTGQLASTPQNVEPVKTTLSLKGTVGPTVASEILQKNGIQSATPETMAEPPLETSVYDSIDKVDADEAGNDPLSEIEQSMLIAQKQAAHDLTQAKTVHEMSRAEELHSEKLKQMRQPKAPNK